MGTRPVTFLLNKGVVLRKAELIVPFHRKFTIYSNKTINALRNYSEVILCVSDTCSIT